MLTQEQQIFEQIKKAENILITFSKTWEGDSVASALAMYLFLKKLGKKAGIAAEKFDPGRAYAFLPGYKDINNSLDNLREFIISLDISNAQVDQIKYIVKNNQLNFIISPKDGFFTHDDITSQSGGFSYDLIIVIDTPDLESLGSIYDNDTEFFYKVPLVNIDHHSGNEEFGQINKVELTAVSTAEILFTLMTEYGKDHIDENIATCLLAGIISKTRSFKTQNITPHALSAASQLISMGARREEIVNYLYRSRPINVLKIWGRVLARLSGDLDNKLVWSILTTDDFSRTDTKENDLSEVIDELIINIPEAKVIALIYESNGDEVKRETPTDDNGLNGPHDSDDSSAADKTTKALIYSMKNINSLSLAKEFNPAGTKAMAKIELAEPLKEAEKKIIESIKEKLGKLPI